MRPNHRAVSCEDPIRFTGGRNFYRYARNNPVRWNDSTGLIHQELDGRLHDDDQGGLEVLCTKGRNIQQDIEMLEPSILTRSTEIESFREEAGFGHLTRLWDGEANLVRCKDECDKDKRPDRETAPFKVLDEWLNWLEDKWWELSYAFRHPQFQTGPSGGGPIFGLGWATGVP
jgi:hypothetical protein